MMTHGQVKARVIFHAIVGIAFGFLHPICILGYWSGVIAAYGTLKFFKMGWWANKNEK